MARHRSIPVIVTPADLRGGVTREVADAMRSGRVRYVGVSEAEARRLLDARSAKEKVVRVAYDEVDDTAWPAASTPYLAGRFDALVAGRRY